MPTRSARRPSSLALHPALRVRAVQVGGTDLTLAEQLEPLLEDVLELLLRAALEEHVPVGAGRLLRLLHGTDPRRAECLRTAARALPDRRHLGLHRHGHLELVTVDAAVAALLTGGELDAPLVLETLSPQPCATQCALCHEVHLQRSVAPVYAPEAYINKTSVPRVRDEHAHGFPVLFNVRRWRGVPTVGRDPGHTGSVSGHFSER